MIIILPYDWAQFAKILLRTSISMFWIILVSSLGGFFCNAFLKNFLFI